MHKNTDPGPFFASGRPFSTSKSHVWEVRTRFWSDFGRFLDFPENTFFVYLFAISMFFLFPPPVATGGAWSTRPGRGDRQWVTIGGRQVLRGQPRGPGLGRHALRRLADRLHPEWASLNERLPNGGHPFGGGWVGSIRPLRFLPSGEEEGWAPARAAVAAEAGGPRVRLRGPPSWRGGGPGQRHRGGEPRSWIGAARCLQLALKKKYIKIMLSRLFLCFPMLS